MRSLGILQTCEVLKAGLPTRVPHTLILGPTGCGDVPPSVAKLLHAQPPIVRVAVLVALYQVPPETYRIGNTRIFFRVGQVSERSGSMYAVVYCCYLLSPPTSATFFYF